MNKLLTVQDTYWAPEEGTERATIEVDLQEKKTFDHIVLKEPGWGKGLKASSSNIRMEMNGNITFGLQLHHDWFMPFLD